MLSEGGCALETGTERTADSSKCSDVSGSHLRVVAKGCPFLQTAFCAATRQRADAGRCASHCAAAVAAAVVLKLMQQGLATELRSAAAVSTPLGLHSVVVVVVGVNERIDESKQSVRLGL